ncbi:class I SAM-dependent methyltransferase [Labilibaculum sp.]|uniref:class I SAM-dependent methyltransferase n=1 Tax=Labilibaculum sp. TaxID=2060723 RepID=UPI002AA74826|nr:class I SAM-dependent methyltransferase [Labilibaculum sp.]
MKEMWDKRYAESKYIYGEKANLFFAAQLSLLSSGRLLLPGEGEGRNAAYASRIGWKVDAFDYSKEAVDNAIRFFEEQKVDVNIYTESILDHPSIEQKYDVAALLYLHLPSRERTGAHRFVADSVKPGGMVLMEVFSKNQLGRKSGGPQNEDLLYDLSEIKRDFEEFDILLLEEVEIDLSEGNLHNGKAMVVRFLGNKKNI